MPKHIHIHLHRTFDAFVASEHPRGQPGNKGQFANKGEGTVSGGGTSEVATKTASREPQPSPQPGASAKARAGSKSATAATEKTNRRIAQLVETYNKTGKTEEDKKKALTDISRSVFQYMGLHENVKLDIKEPYDFTVGDKKFRTGGWFSPDENKITICSTNDPANPYIAGLVCHEAQHAKFHAVELAYREESDEIFNEEVHGGKDILKPDDSIREQYQSQFPVHAALGGWPTKYDKVDQLKKDDGITDYSRAYWDAFNKGTGNWITAVNETLSEMAKLDHEGSLSRLIWYKQSKSFKPLYNAINKLYPQVAGGANKPPPEKHQGY